MQDAAGNGAAEDRGRTSIIVPTRGPSQLLRELLLSLARALPTDADVEVVLVHDGPGTDFTEVTRDLTGRIVIGSTGTRRGPGAARNVGFELATGWRIVFLDDDVVLPVDWFDGLEAAWIAHPDAGLIGARIGSLDPSNLLSQAFETFVVRHDNRRGRWYLATACVAVRRAAFQRLGGFDERLSTSGEDWDLCRRAHDLGIPVLATDLFHVQHRNPTRPHEVLSRARSYAHSFGVARPLSPSDADRPLAIGSIRLPARTAKARPWIRAAKALFLAMPLELAARIGIAAARDLPYPRRVGVAVVHLPWFVTYWISGVSNELRRNRQALLTDAGHRYTSP